MWEVVARRCWWCGWSSRVVLTVGDSRLWWSHMVTYVVVVMVMVARGDVRHVVVVVTCGDSDRW
jgi:hypothetical protein